MRRAAAVLLTPSALALGLPTTVGVAPPAPPALPAVWTPGGGSKDRRKGIAGRVLVRHVTHGRRPLVKAMGGRRQYLKTDEAMKRVARGEPYETRAQLRRQGAAA